MLAMAAAAALAALALALHSAHRTRAYQRAADKESLTDSDGKFVFNVPFFFERAGSIFM